ncbi:caspase domain-containing protein [Armillaria novae-zelandiae]|uniref:Caspase domain-containing protein n=1 Tax=Armillaria novae-zelandiae TaxID=153914 RepID=A0AA39PTD9_9AGAR|nr:caspase domain-containing protein [Armillaria novae-zelandiae]
MFLDIPESTPSATGPDTDMEFQSLEELEKRLAQRYGMHPEVIDSEAVLKEALKRETLWGRFSRTFLLFLQKANLMLTSGGDVEALYRLRDLRDGRRLDPQPVPAPPNSYHVEASRFWAVLIGIDAYETYPLHGCVSDASLMKRFLTEDVGVPEHRIQCLLGFKNPPTGPGGPLTPSRTNIVNTLRSLINNPEIEQNDNIIVYYAGHGASYTCSEHFSTPESGCQTGSCPIQALCPIDRDTMDSDERWIPDISHRELNVILTQISLAKGHHITFITDCCYASSFERQGRDLVIRTTRPTFHSDVNDMLRVADQNLKHLPRYQSVLSKDWCPDTSSYVLLTPCQDYQYARESAGSDGVYNGMMTKILLDVLPKSWKEGSTYVELTDRLNQSYAQTPIIAGDHIYERIWYQL